MWCKPVGGITGGKAFETVLPQESDFMNFFAVNIKRFKPFGHTGNRFYITTSR